MLHYNNYLLNHIRDYVTEHKPDYMAPSFVVKLDKIPLNVNGKVTIELQKKIGEGYATDSTLLEAVNGSTIQSSGQFTITGITTLNLKFSELMEYGNYQLLFTIYDNDGNELKVLSYKFIVV